jgi:hypothetical protein
MNSSVAESRPGKTEGKPEKPKIHVAVEMPQVGRLLVRWRDHDFVFSMDHKGNPKVRIRSVVAPEIRDKIEASARTAELRDTLNLWRKRMPVEDRDKVWLGTAVELRQSFCNVFDNSSLTNQWPVRVLGARMQRLSNKPDSGVSVAQRRYGRDKVILWRIEPPPPETPDEVPF